MGANDTDQVPDAQREQVYVLARDLDPSTGLLILCGKQLYSLCKSFVALSQSFDPFIDCHSQIL